VLDVRAVIAPIVARFALVVAGARLDAARATWLHQHAPEPLQRVGPQGLLWWQWLALPIVAALAWAIGRVLAWGTRAVLCNVVKRTRTEWDDHILAGITSPLVLAWSIVAARLLVPIIELERGGSHFVHRLLSAGFLVAIFWMLLRVVVVAGSFAASAQWARSRPAVLGVLPLGVRVAQVATLLMGVIAVLSELGYPVASLIAGLGIGGLAIALAAQKTVENLFGSIALSVDQPFRVGDFVKVDDLLGNVEVVGLRSTRIRTLDRTLVTIPNGKLADMRIENFAARDRLRFACMVALQSGASEVQVRAALAGIQGVLGRQPKVAEGFVVRLQRFGEWSLDVEVVAYVLSTDWSELQKIREELLLGFLGAVEAAGARLAVPTRTVHLLQREQPESGRRDVAAG
jgi:MscS family membrane protein